MLRGAVMSARILVTGASGFVGRHLTAVLAELGHEVRAAVRTAPPLAAGSIWESIMVGNLDSDTDWWAALDAVGVVVHLAALPSLDPA